MNCIAIRNRESVVRQKGLISIRGHGNSATTSGAEIQVEGEGVFAEIWEQRIENRNHELNKGSVSLES